MMRYSVPPREKTFVKGYEFLSFARNISKSIGKNINKNFSGEYSQKFLDHAKQSATNAFKTASKIAIHKTAEATSDSIGTKIANKIAKASKNLQRNNSETVTNEHDKEIPTKIYLSPEKIQKAIDDLRLKEQYNNGICKNHKSFKKFTKNCSKTVTNKNGKEIPKEIPKERYKSPEERQKIIDNLRSIIIV